MDQKDAGDKKREVDWSNPADRKQVLKGCLTFIIAVSITIFLINLFPDDDSGSDDDSTQLPASTTERLVKLVRASGYRCDSVDSALPMMFKDGFVLVCDQYRYRYEIVDRGGKWVVTVD